MPPVHTQKNILNINCDGTKIHQDLTKGTALEHRLLEAGVLCLLGGHALAYRVTDSCNDSNHGDHNTSDGTTREFVRISEQV